MKVIALAGIVFVLAVYCPDVGRGFVKDDFTWIRAARAATASPRTLILQQDAGFYRPLVTLAFAFDYARSGWKPRAYGWTNLALYVLCAGAVAFLARELGLSPWAAVVAAFVWAVNPHGINMAVLWLSGRTATLLTLCSVVAAIAYLRRWYSVAAVAVMLALFSKEEAVVLPFVLLAWAWIRAPRAVPPRAAIAAAVVPLILYLTLRALTPAMTFATAPSFYRMTADPPLVLRNVFEYLDRSTTLAAATLVVAWIAYGTAPRITTDDRRVLGMAAVWWVGMFAITIWLPVRSSLYAVCPSVACAIASALVIDRMRTASTRRVGWFEPAAALLLLAAIPVYQSRDGLRVEAARVSDRTLNEIAQDAATLPASGVIVLHDDPAVAVFREAFGDLPAEALRTRFGREWDARIERSSLPVRRSPGHEAVIAEYWISRGTIARTSAAARE